MPMDAPMPDGRLAEKSDTSASLIDFKEYVAAMFVLNYLQIDPSQIRKAAQIAKSSGNIRFFEIASKIISGLAIADAAFADAEHRLGAVIGQKHAEIVRTCDMWRLNRGTKTVRISSTKTIKLKPSQSTPLQTKRYWAFWTLSHRQTIAADMLRSVRDCAKDAPLAPDTYYTVLQKTNKIDFMHTFEKMIKNAYHISKLAARA